MPTSLDLVKGIGPATAGKLATAGISAAEDLAASSPDQVAAVPGFGEIRAKQVIAHARRLIADSATVADARNADKPSTPPKDTVKSKKDKPEKKKDEKKKSKKDKKKKDKNKKKKNKSKKGAGKKDGAKKKAKKKKK